MGWPTCHRSTRVSPRPDAWWPQGVADTAWASVRAKPWRAGRTPEAD